MLKSWEIGSQDQTLAPLLGNTLKLIALVCIYLHFNSLDVQSCLVTNVREPTETSCGLDRSKERAMYRCTVGGWTANGYLFLAPFSFHLIVFYFV